MEVNQYYLCDQGRLDYRWLNRRDRAELPYVRSAGVVAGQGGQLTPADWEEAIAEAAAVINGARAFVLASPMLSNEALYLLSRVVERTGGRGVFAVRTGPEAPLAGVPDLSLRRDRAANVAGAELFGFERREAADVLAGLGAGDVLVVADEELDGVTVRLPAGVRVVVIGTTVAAWAAAAEVVLPTANMAEEEGTFTNLRGRVQRFLQAKSPPGLARASWSVLGDLLAAMGEGAGYWAAAEAFDALAAAHPRFAGLSYDTLGLRGQLVAEEGAAAAEPATAGAA